MKKTTSHVPAPKWAGMTAGQRAIFVGKICVMVCTGGFICGGVLVEGMEYPELKQPSE